MHTVPIGLALLYLFTPTAIAFLISVVYRSHRASKSRIRRRQSTAVVAESPSERVVTRHERNGFIVIVVLTLLATHANSQTPQIKGPDAQSTVESLQRKLDTLEQELTDVKAQLNALRAAEPVTTEPLQATTPTSATLAATEPAAQEHKLDLLPPSATLNVTVDGYYGYNFNNPPGRVNSLRAYDVLSDSFSLNQAAVIFELPVDPVNGRRFGTRLDLQFGQATATLQGNSANENRPDIYRNIFQAYGRYVVPVGHGLTVDFGKWASSLGFEGNYTKDQLNYTRSFFFYYLPFYHMGFRTNYQLNDHVAVNYWLTNGTQQTEPFNSFKDQMFGVNLTPTHSVSWNINYYLGQEHPDVTPSANCGTAPLQPGLCFSPIPNPPNGKTHIFDTYLSWQATPKLLLGGEADYVIQRQWAQAAPGQSSAPSHVDGGAAYTQYQFTPKFSLVARAEYLSDRGGLFSGTTQALKETTGTASYRFGQSFLAMLEYRRDWSNQQFFPTGSGGAHTDHQDTATMGLVWWSGGKNGTW